MKGDLIQLCIQFVPSHQIMDLFLELPLISVVIRLKTISILPQPLLNSQKPHLAIEKPTNRFVESPTLPIIFTVSLSLTPFKLILELVKSVPHRLDQSTSSNFIVPCLFKLIQCLDYHYEMSIEVLIKSLERLFF